VRGGDAVTVLAPHAAGLPARWEEDGVAVRTFRYAPVGAEVLGYGRSLEADERVRGAALAVAPLYALAARRAAARLLDRQPFDFFHAHWLVPNAVAAPGRQRRTPLAVGLHGSDVFLAERRELRPFVRRTLRRTALLTGCSPELVDRVCALGFPVERARVIPYGVDIGAFCPGRARGLAWRRRLGVPEAAPLLLGVGRMATKKGFQVLLEAAPAVLEAHPDAHLVLAGGGDLLPRLRAAAAPWPGRVHFPGPVGRDELPDLFRASDLFVLPAVHDARGNVDGLPNVILEAMASGLPVVATRISGIPLAVEDETTGLLVAEGDHNALAVALRQLLAAPERRRAMGEAGRRKVERELTWDAVAARHRVAYVEALAGRLGGRSG
jgi:glycosyltransferase involved in cell wall biosynthesis